MTITTLSRRELNQDVTRAKKATKNGPVFITDRGKPAHVLLSSEEYQRLTKQRRSIADSLAVPGVADIEFEPGVLSIERKDATQGAVLRAWLDQHVLPEFSERTLPVDTAVARRCARLHVPDKRGERDALIAATALVHGMTVVTRNVDDFQSTGLTSLNPWQSIIGDNP